MFFLYLFFKSKLSVSKSRGLLDVSLIRGFWKWGDRSLEDGYVVTSCKKECYFVTCFSPYSEVCENPTGGRSWFFHLSWARDVSM